MDDFGLYDDLDEFQEQQEKQSKQVQAVEETLKQTLETVEKLREENTTLKKNIEQMKMGFQTLLDTARSEIRRKDKQIERLNKEKDDICFRRKIVTKLDSRNENLTFQRNLVENPFRCNPIKGQENSNEPAVPTPNFDKQEKSASTKYSDQDVERHYSNDLKLHRIEKSCHNEKYHKSSYEKSKDGYKSRCDDRGGKTHKDNVKECEYNSESKRKRSRDRKDCDKYESNIIGSCSRSSEKLSKKDSKSPRKIYKHHSDSSRTHSRDRKVSTEKYNKNLSDNISKRLKKETRQYSQKEENKRKSDKQTSKTLLKEKKVSNIVSKDVSKNKSDYNLNSENEKSVQLDIVTPNFKKLSMSEVNSLPMSRKKAPIESTDNLASSTQKENLILNNTQLLKSEVKSLDTNSIKHVTDTDSNVSSPSINSIEIISSSSSTPNNIIKDSNKQKTANNSNSKSGDGDDIGKCFTPIKNVKTIACLDNLTEVVNDINNEQQFTQIPGLDLYNPWKKTMDKDNDNATTKETSEEKSDITTNEVVTQRDYLKDIVDLDISDLVNEKRITLTTNDATEMVGIKNSNNKELAEKIIIANSKIIENIEATENFKLPADKSDYKNVTTEISLTSLSPVATISFSDDILTKENIQLVQQVQEYLTNEVAVIESLNSGANVPLKNPYNVQDSPQKPQDNQLCKNVELETLKGNEKIDKNLVNIEIENKPKNDKIDEYKTLSKSMDSIVQSTENTVACCLPEKKTASDSELIANLIDGDESIVLKTNNKINTAAIEENDFSNKGSGSQEENKETLLVVEENIECLTPKKVTENVKETVISSTVQVSISNLLENSSINDEHTSAKIIDNQESSLKTAIEMKSIANDEQILTAESEQRLVSLSEVTNTVVKTTKTSESAPNKTKPASSYSLDSTLTSKSNELETLALIPNANEEYIEKNLLKPITMYDSIYDDTETTEINIVQKNLEQKVVMENNAANKEMAQNCCDSTKTEYATDVENHLLQSPLVEKNIFKMVPQNDKTLITNSNDYKTMEQTNKDLTNISDGREDLESFPTDNLKIDASESEACTETNKSYQNQFNIISIPIPNEVMKHTQKDLKESILSEIATTDQEIIQTPNTKDTIFLKDRLVGLLQSTINSKNKGETQVTEVNVKELNSLCDQSNISKEVVTNSKFSANEATQMLENEVHDLNNSFEALNCLSKDVIAKEALSEVKSVKMDAENKPPEESAEYPINSIPFTKGLEHVSKSLNNQAPAVVVSQYIDNCNKNTLQKESNLEKPKEKSTQSLSLLGDKNLSEIESSEHENVYADGESNKSAYSHKQQKSWDSLKDLHSQDSLHMDKSKYVTNEIKHTQYSLEGKSTNDNTIDNACNSPAKHALKCKAFGSEATKSSTFAKTIKEINIEGKIVEVVKNISVFNETFLSPKKTVENIIDLDMDDKQVTTNYKTDVETQCQLVCSINLTETKTTNKEIKSLLTEAIPLEVVVKTKPNTEEVFPKISLTLSNAYNLHSPALPSISTTYPTPSNFSGIFSKISSPPFTVEDDITKSKKKYPNVNGKPKEYILPAASVLCNVDNLENATKSNKKLHWESLDNKNEMTEIEDDADIDTTNEEPTEIRKEELADICQKQSQKSSLSGAENETGLNVLAQLTKKQPKLKYSSLHKIKHKLSKDIKARLNSNEELTNIALSKRPVGRPRKVHNALPQKQRNIILSSKWDACKLSQAVVYKDDEFSLNAGRDADANNCASLEGYEKINNLENSVKHLSTSVEKLEICDETCSSQDVNNPTKYFANQMDDFTKEDAYNSLLIYHKHAPSTDLFNTQHSTNTTSKQLKEVESVCELKKSKFYNKDSKAAVDCKEAVDSNKLNINGCDKAYVPCDKTVKFSVQEHHKAISGKGEAQEYYKNDNERNNKLFEDQQALRKEKLIKSQSSTKQKLTTNEKAANSVSLQDLGINILRSISSYRIPKIRRNTEGAMTDITKSEVQGLKNLEVKGQSIRTAEKKKYSEETHTVNKDDKNTTDIKLNDVPNKSLTKTLPSSYIPNSDEIKTAKNKLLSSQISHYHKIKDRSEATEQKHVEIFDDVLPDLNETQELKAIKEQQKSSHYPSHVTKYDNIEIISSSTKISQNKPKNILVSSSYEQTIKETSTLNKTEHKLKAYFETSFKDQEMANKNEIETFKNSNGIEKTQKITKEPIKMCKKLELEIRKVDPQTNTQLNLQECNKISKKQMLELSSNKDTIIEKSDSLSKNLKEISEPTDILCSLKMRRTFMYDESTLLNKEKSDKISQQNMDKISKDNAILCGVLKSNSIDKKSAKNQLLEKEKKLEESVDFESKSQVIVHQRQDLDNEKSKKELQKRHHDGRRDTKDREGELKCVEKRNLKIKKSDLNKSTEALNKISDEAVNENVLKMHQISTNQYEILKDCQGNNESISKQINSESTSVDIHTQERKTTDPKQTIGSDIKTSIKSDFPKKQHRDSLQQKCHNTTEEQNLEIPVVSSTQEKIRADVKENRIKNRRKSTSHRRITSSSEDDEPLTKKPCLTAVNVEAPLPTVAKRRQRRKRVVKILSTTIESTSDATNTSQTAISCQTSPFSALTLNHSIFNTEVSTQSESELATSLTLTRNHQDDKEFKEIDAKLQEIFQSPPLVNHSKAVTSPTALNDSQANITIDETLDVNGDKNQNTSSAAHINESIKFINETSMFGNSSEIKHLSLRSADYRFEKVSDNVINLFISRKRKRKSSK